MAKWIIVGFRHPEQKRSRLYRFPTSNEELIRAILKGIEKGCNLFSIRGFEE